MKTHTNILTENARQAVRQLVDDLARGDFTALAADGRIGRLTESDVRRVIGEYGRTLLPLPDEAMQLIDVYPRDSPADGLALDVPLWTLEEGRSDLTLQLSLVESETLRITMQDLRVL